MTSYPALPKNQAAAHRPATSSALVMTTLPWYVSLPVNLSTEKEQRHGMVQQVPPPTRCPKRQYGQTIAPSDPDNTVLGPRLGP